MDKLGKLNEVKKVYEKNNQNKNLYCKKIAKIINDIGEYKSLMEVGIGEATTLGNVIKEINNENVDFYGFDLSWSRIKYAKKFLKKNNINNVNLYMEDLFCLPIKDNLIDIVYTSHSIEPNGGREEEALRELYRITNKYLILLEPCYEYATKEARERMISHGYVTNLYDTAKKWDIIVHRLFGVNANPLNPTGLIIIRKNINVQTLEVIDENWICCPITKKNLILEKIVTYVRRVFCYILL